LGQQHPAPISRQLASRPTPSRCRERSQDLGRNRGVILLSAPYPLLDEGCYLASCIEATFAWARQWKKWIARLVLEHVNYTGRPYTGKLCKFLSLGCDPNRPFAGQHSLFRQLWVSVNGAQPASSEVTLRIFQGVLFCLSVETVKKDRHGNQRAPEHWYSVVRAIHPARPDCPQHSNTAPANS